MHYTVNVLAYVTPQARMLFWVTRCILQLTSLPRLPANANDRSIITPRQFMGGSDPIKFL